MNIAITGFMASGKSHISSELARLLGYNLVDTDKEIERSANMTINDIFKKYGEEYFRNLESEICKKVSMLDNTIISTGGGLVLKKQNIDDLRKNAIIVNLDADFSVIEARIAGAAATRPLMRGSSVDELKQRFENRKPFYADCDFSIKVTNEKKPYEQAQIIISELKNRNLI